MTYGDKRDYPKIDIFHKTLGYLASTTWAATCKEAVDRYAKAHDYRPDVLYGRFDRGQP